MNSKTSQQDDIRELAETIKDLKVAMLTTTTTSGGLVSRPLYTRDVGFNGELWFFTSLDSRKVDELAAHPNVNVAYVDVGSERYVSIEGTAEAVKDRGKVESLWRDAIDKLYFKGPDDPNLVLLRIDARSAETWKAGGNVVSRAYRFVKAVVSGNPNELGEQKHVELGR